MRRRWQNAVKCRSIICNYFPCGGHYFCYKSRSVFDISKGKEIPEVVRYLGRVLTPAVIGMLVVYCLRATPVAEAPHGIPEAAAVFVTAALHAWKRNNLLSIGAGTVLYMVLIQVFF